MKKVFLVAAIFCTLTVQTWANIETLSSPVSNESEVSVQDSEQVFSEKLQKIEALIHQKNHREAVYQAIREFQLDDSACKFFEVRPITTTDEQGGKILATTPLTQIVAIDPSGLAFKSAKFLVSTLAHEITHCHQHQKLYLQALQTDEALEPFKKAGILELKTLSDLDELSSVAEKKGPMQAEALKKFNSTIAKLGLPSMPAAEFIRLAKIAAADIQGFSQKIGALVEMQALLASFEVPGLLAPKDAQSEEFKFHLRQLEVATQQFIRQRKLLGASPELLCKLSNSVPFSLTIQTERVCVESITFLSAFATEAASK